MPPMALTESQVVIVYFFGIKYNYIDQSVVCAANSFHMIDENTLLKSGFPGTYRTMGHRTLVGPYEMIIMFELP